MDMTWYNHYGTAPQNLGYSPDNHSYIYNIYIAINGVNLKIVILSQIAIV